MTSLADQLPPEIARHVHPDWRRNESEYWRERSQFLSRFAGQWVAFANRQVIASGPHSVEIMAAAQQSGLHPFVTCVGHEAEPCRIRRVSFAYDAGYPSQALPILSAEFASQKSSPGTMLDRVIPDTGRGRQRLAVVRLSTSPP
jgi:hypothetical protein